jgi:hypothetical protein
MKKHIYYIEAIVEVPVLLRVAGADEQEAFGQAVDGAWHGVMPVDWDKAKVKAVGTFTKGPGLNPGKVER